MGFIKTKKQLEAEKQLDTFYKVLPLTNWVILLQKKVFTIEEWSLANKRLTEFLVKKEAEGKIKDYVSLINELQDEVDSWEEKNKQLLEEKKTKKK